MRGTGRFGVVAVAVCATVAAGWLLAGNMAFKINYPLYRSGSNGSRSGTQTLSLPYSRQVNLTDSLSLIQDIEGGGPPFSKVITVAKFLPATDTLCAYTGRHGTPCANFNLVPGEYYAVQTSGDLNYIIWGADNPSLAVQLNAAGPSSRSGLNAYSPPYNIVARNAYELMLDIEAISSPPFSKVVSVGKFLIGSDSLQVYTGRMGTPQGNFNLVPGEGYKIQMSQSVSYLASHY